MYQVKAVYKQEGKYYVCDDKETGKWTFPGVELQKEEPERGVINLMKFLIDNTDTAPVGMELDYTTEHKHPFTGGSTKTDLYLIEDWAGDLRLNTKWVLVAASELLRTGNVDTSTREYLQQVKIQKSALYQLNKLHKEASGPVEPHRSVSAVIEDDKGRMLLMEHKYQKIWSIPKGHIDEGENARSAIVRELEEELGIKVKPEDAVLATWYVETYRNGDKVTPVKHYIYNIKGYEGTIRNAEKERFGNIKMVWAQPADVQKMKDVSFMTTKAAELISKKASGFLKSLPLYLAAGMVLPSIIRTAVPSTREADINSLKNNLRDLKNRYESSGLNELLAEGGSAISDAYNYNWKDQLDRSVLSADNNIKKGVTAAGEYVEPVKNAFKGLV